jgi:hypothetical protein
LKRLDALINRHTVSGARYKATTQAEIDTEEFRGRVAAGVPRSSPHAGVRPLPSTSPAWPTRWAMPSRAAVTTGQLFGQGMDEPLAP